MDTYDFLADPRTLTLDERRAARDSYAEDQVTWLARLRTLAEGPVPEDDFPAFLLATAPFAALAARLGEVDSKKDLPADVSDELSWFLRVFADYLKTCDGEEVFPESPRLTG